MTNQCRDMSKAQFKAAAAKLGFAPDFLGYWRLAPPFSNVSVYIRNVGERRRSQLAYLIAEQNRVQNRFEVTR